MSETAVERTPEEKRALDDFAAAFKAMSPNGSGSQMVEDRYGIAYQRLVRLGLRRQIRSKYRSR